jgi:hypothetical protein
MSWVAMPLIAPSNYANPADGMTGIGDDAAAEQKGLQYIIHHVAY